MKTLQETDRKTIFVRLVLLVGYVLLFAPYIYSVFYSMPANDDFQYALSWWSSNVFVEAINRVKWNYLNCFGQSGIFAIIVQIVLNPLHWFQNKGNSFGICMVIVFVIVYGGILLATRRILKYIFINAKSITLDIFTFLLAFMIFATDYYNDVYNWWSGMPGYSMMLLLTVINLGNILKYCAEKTNTNYIMMIIFGILCCSGLMNCVVTGAFYVLFVFIKKNEDSLLKKSIPLALYVVSGLVTVLAPGNGKRMSYENTNNLDVQTTKNYVGAAYVSVYDMVQRMIQILMSKPWVILISVIIIILGIWGARAIDKKPSRVMLILGIICTLLGGLGAVYPYVLGKNSQLGDELACRVYFVLDYIIFIGMALCLFGIGVRLAKDVGESIYNTYSCGIQIFLILIFVLWCKICPYTTYFVPVDIINNAQIIKETNQLWSGILDEIASSEDKDVVVEKQNVTWCRYVYPVGLLSDDSGDWPVSEDIYNGGCNQCVAKLYGKDSVRVILQE